MSESAQTLASETPQLALNKLLERRTDLQRKLDDRTMLRDDNQIAFKNLSVEVDTLLRRITLNSDMSVQDRYDDAKREKIAARDIVDEAGKAASMLEHAISELNTDITKLQATIEIQDKARGREYGAKHIDTAIEAFREAAANLMVMTSLVNDFPAHHVRIELLSDKYMPGHIVDQQISQLSSALLDKSNIKVR